MLFSKLFMLATTEPILSCLRFNLLLPVSPISHIVSTTLGGFHTLLDLESTLPYPVLVSVPVLVSTPASVSATVFVKVLAPVFAPSLLPSQFPFCVRSLAATPVPAPSLSPSSSPSPCVCVCVFVFVQINTISLNHIHRYTLLPVWQVVIKRYECQKVTCYLNHQGSTSR